MDDSIFKRIDEVVADAGSKNGYDIAHFLHIDVVTHAGPFVGYSMRIGRYTTISTHEDLNRLATLLIIDHEIMHVVNNDFEDFDGTNGAVFDREAYNAGANKRLA